MPARQHAAGKPAKRSHPAQPASARASASSPLYGASPRAQAMAQLQASVAQSPHVRTQRNELRSMFGPTQPVQRVIAGLEQYTDPNNIPANWVTAYHRDIHDNETHLTDADLLFLYNFVRGKTPDQEGVAFIHSGNHWDVQIGVTVYHATPDGSCAIHAVDLANRVLKGEVIDPGTYHTAQKADVINARAELARHLGEEDNPAEIKQIIAKGIKDAELVLTSGFGPELRNLLGALVIQSSAAGYQDLFDLAYVQYNWKAWSLPKPSSAKTMLSKTGFFGQKFASLEDMMTKALTQLHRESNSGVGVDFSGSTYTKPVSHGVQKAIPHVLMANEARASLGKLASKSSPKKSSATKKTPERTLKKHRLPNRRLLSEERRNILRGKLKNKIFIRKLMLASKKGRISLEGTSAEIAEAIGKGAIDLSALGRLSSAQKIAAFAAFKKRKTKDKKDLQFGLPGSSAKSSFGKGGFQVKGLGTYPAEVVWYAEKLKTWPGGEAEIFAAVQERNRAELARLTGSTEDADRLLRLEDLQTLERWRADVFGTGVAAHARVGYHGGTTLPGYLLSMPMRESDATTNVTKTTDLDNPHDKAMWESQTASMVQGIQNLMDVEIADGATYDERSRLFLEQAVDEIEDGEPSDALVNASAEFMQSPNPYQNDDPF